MSDLPRQIEPPIDLASDTPARPFDDWRRAVAALAAGEKIGAPHAELVRLSEEVIRTRNVLALDRLAAGMLLPEQTARYLPVDERLLSEEDDTTLLSEEDDTTLLPEEDDTTLLPEQDDTTRDGD